VAVQEGLAGGRVRAAVQVDDISAGAATGMQSFCGVAFGSSAATAARPLSVSAHFRAPPRNPANSARGGNQVPAMLVAVAFRCS